jgi:ADP-ribosyl-[dinitrogen reductase] hydrolase
MRMVPAALFSLGSDDLLRRAAIAQAHLTHNNDLSDAACCCYGRMIHLALLGRSKMHLRREADLLCSEFPTFSFEPYRGLATGFVVDTLQTVCHHFFRGKSFEECLVGTVNQGGDADTTGAIVGGLAGAYYGPEGLPLRWLKKLDRRILEELHELASALVRLSPLVRDQGATDAAGEHAGRSPYRASG